MAPPFTLRMADAVRAGNALALLAEIGHPSGTARYWTGIGTITWGGYDYTGAGRLGSVSPVKQTSDLAIQEIVFALAGVTPDQLAELDDEVRNLSARVWFACLNERGEIVADPYELLDVLLDYQSFAASDAGESTLSITGRSGFYTLERALNEAWTAEDQKQTYPTDTGLDMIASLQNQDVQWKPS